MAGFNNFDVASMLDRERAMQQEQAESEKQTAVQTSSMALNTIGSVLGMFFPPVGAALQAASSGVQIGGAASKSVDHISRTASPFRNGEGRLNGVHYIHQSNVNRK